MLTFLEAHTKPDPADIMPSFEMLANPDVSDLSEADRQDTIDDLKIVYPDATFRWHYCNHDFGGGCTTKDI